MCFYLHQSAAVCIVVKYKLYLTAPRPDYKSESVSKIFCKNRLVEKSSYPVNQPKITFEGFFFSKILSSHGV